MILIFASCKIPREILSIKGMSSFKPLAAATAKSLQSCPTLCYPIDSSPLGSSVPGILQARILEWVAISFSNAWKWSHSVVSESLATSCQSFIRKGQKDWVFAPPAVGDEPHDQPWKRMFLEEYFHRSLECGVRRECAIIKLKNLIFSPCFPPCTNSSSWGREGKSCEKCQKSSGCIVLMKTCLWGMKTYLEWVVNSSLIDIPGRI